MARIYVASSWRNERQPNVVARLRAVGHLVYDFRNPSCDLAGFQWSDIGLDPENCTAREYRNALLTHPRAAQGFMSDLRAMQWADACVLVLPCGRSAHLEAGWFCGQGKRTIILTGDGEQPELMALLANEICVNMLEVETALQEFGPALEEYAQ